MKLRRIAIFLLIILSVASLFTCGKKVTEKQDLKKLTTYGRYWTGVLEFMKMTAIPEFKKKSGLDIDMVVYNDTIETLERVRLETKSGDPTAHFIWIDFMDIAAYIEQDLLMDITDIVGPYADKIPAKMLNPCKGPDGKIYAVPHMISIDLLMYNENNIQLDDLPQTYAELLTWCKNNPNRYSYRGIGEHLTTSLMNFFYAFGALEEGQDLSQFFNPEENPEIVSVFEYLIELNKYTKKPLYTDYSAMDLEMANEMLWLYSLWDDHLAKIRHNRNAPHVRLHPSYNLAGPTGKRAICLGGWLFAVPKNSADPVRGKEFVSWIMSQEMQVKSVGDSSRVLCGHIPARIDAVQNMPDYMKSWFDVSDVESLRKNAFEALVVRPTWAPYYFDFSTLAQRAHDEIVIQGKPIDVVLKNIQAELDLFIEASAF